MKSIPGAIAVKMYKQCFKNIYKEMLQKCIPNYAVKESRS